MYIPKRQNTEHREAVSLVQWWDYYAHAHGIDHRLFMHVPNEGRRSIVAGYQAKLAGLRPGSPDYFLALPSGNYHGLFIELKAGKGKTSASQREMLHVLGKAGYAVEICYGWQDASKEIHGYLNRQETEENNVV